MRRALITVCVLIATVTQTLDSTIANVALPYMQGSMAVSQEEISWVLTTYIVAAAIMTAPTGYLARRFGRTRVFVVSILGFTAASILCGMAQSLDQIILFRILQGVLGASLLPLSQSTMLDIWPPEQHGTAMAIWMTGGLIGPVLGPTLGGWLTANFDWRWVFYINLPLGIMSALGLWAFLKETPVSRSARLDWTGFLALGIGIGALQTMLDRGQTLDWFASREIQVEAVLTGLGFYVFITQSLLAPKPFLSPGMFKDLNFVSAATVMFVLSMIVFASMALLAPYLQVLMNYPVATAGLIMAPRGAGAILVAPFTNWILKTIGPRAMTGLGFVAAIYALYDMTSWTPDISVWPILTAGFALGLATSFISIPLATAGFATLPVELRSEAASMFALSRNLGSSVGISITAALLVANTQVNHAIISAAVTPFNRVLQSGGPLHFWNPSSPMGVQMLNQIVTRQSNIIAYVDNFKLMLVLVIVATPLALLIRNARPKPGTVTVVVE